MATVKTYEYFGVLMKQTCHCGVNRNVMKGIIILRANILVLKQRQTVNIFSNYCESQEDLSGLKQYWNLQETCAQLPLQQTATCTVLIILYCNKYTDDVSQYNAVYRAHRLLFKSPVRSINRPHICSEVCPNTLAYSFISVTFLGAFLSFRNLKGVINNSNKSLSSIKGRKVCDCLIDCYLLEKG
jgi:hypothetical protein